MQALARTAFRSWKWGEIVEQLIYSIYFTGLLNLMGEFLKAGKEVPQELIEETREIGQKAEVPEDILSAFDFIFGRDPNATIH